MSDEELIEKLLEGSRNLEHIRRKTSQTIKLVVGFTQKLPKNRRIRISEIFDANENEWWVVGRFDLKLINITYRIKNEKGGRDAYRFETITSVEHYPNGLVDVIEVWNALPYFVEGVRKVFPDLDDAWQHILEASPLHLAL